jgi:flagellar FliL protein
MMIAPVLVLVLAGVGFFFLKPSGAPEKKPAPVPGAILQLEPQSVNLAGGHFLKLGFALQATKAAGEELDGARRSTSRSTPSAAARSRSSPPARAARRPRSC